ncbi:hypothetical protein LPJ53_002743 [Coemansia erecta]|uniref:Extracellular membrane protein CFEM domain-containing protein n=1 Tax=Coemansia erecta TaxID=147472 RepID=A0A9W7Y2N5_9FUNG|nr:hypothetical protein LPJ53_002743 [Coemansia erecta]
MRLVIPILFATALATSSTVLARVDTQGPTYVQKRQGIVDTIQDGINNAIQNAQDLFDIGHAGEESSDNAGNNNDNNADTTPTTPASDTTKSSSTSSKTTSSSSATTNTSKTSSPDANDDNSDADSKTTKTSSTTTKDSDTTTDSGDDNTDDNNDDSDPQPTGDSCSTEGEKKCDSSGSSSYSLCQDGNWISQKCGGSDICGTDSQGAIACIDKDATVVQLESCSKKKQQRCSSSDSTKYQTCDGKYWQSYSCDDGKQCSLKDNKAVCGSTDSASGGASAYDPDSYSQISQVAFVPQSTAGRTAPLVGALLALAVGAGLYM